MPLAWKNCTCKMSRNLNLVKLVFRVVWQPGVVHARSEQSNLRRAISLRLLASCLSLHNGKVSWNIDFLYQWWMSCMHACILYALFTLVFPIRSVHLKTWNFWLRDSQGRDNALSSSISTLSMMFNKTLYSPILTNIVFPYLFDNEQ